MMLILAALDIQAQDTTLIAPGSTWKYLDNGSNQGSTWSQTSFNDASWAAGPAQLGYGDGDEATVVSYGSSSFNKYITTYFRKTITIPSVTQFSGFILNILRDDGAVVYVNGNEVFRTNMPSGSVSNSTWASAAMDGADETTWISTTISPTAFSTGTNVIAVEVHQNLPTSSDLTFDFELKGSTNASTVVRGPYLQSGTPNSMIIHWRTNAAEGSKVVYGTNPANLNQTISSPASVTEHIITLTGLQPNTKYYYAIGNPSTTYPTDTNHFFKTSPPHGTAQPIRIWAVGDAGTGTDEQRRVRDAYIAHKGNKHTDVWLMLGDNAYEGGKDDEYQQKVFGNNTYEHVMKNHVLWPTLGNHDYNNNIPFSTYYYFDIFDLPTNAEAGGVASGEENYYSYNYGNVHFVVLDSYKESRDSNGTMATWLKQDLTANQMKWTVIYFHHPPYTKGSHDSDDGILDFELPQIRQNLLPIFENFGVDLVLNGHSHSYERSHLLDGHYGNSSSLTSAMVLDNSGGHYPGACPYRKTPDPHKGTVYAVVGCSGKISGGDLDHPAHYISRNKLGSMIIDIEGDMLRASFINDSAVVVDSFAIVKRRNANYTANISGQTMTLTASWHSGSYLWNTGATTQSIVINNPVAGTMYTVTDPNSCLTDTITLQMVSREESWPSTIQVYPNPANEFVQMDLNQQVSKNTELKILDLSGKVLQIMSLPSSSFKINTSELPVGQYILQLTMDQVIYSKTFIIQR